MISSSTPGDSNDNKSSLGIVQSHVYTILSIHNIDGQRLLRLRNPWGRETYNSTWSDGDTSNWDENIRSQVPYVDANEGVFFIDLTTYHSQFKSTSVHFDTTDMTQTYFLATNDDMPNNPNPNRA